MATLTPTVSIGEPRTALDRDGGMPPTRGGGGDDGSDYGSPYFDVRLRRARPGLGGALAGLVMGVRSFTRRDVARAGRQAAGEAALAQVGSIPGISLKQGMKISWLALTVVLGCSFLTGQWMAWRELAASGFYVASSPSSSFVYLLTGMHGLHLLGGVLALLAAGSASLLCSPVASRLIFLDATGWDWHFMAFLWVYIFCLLEFVR